MNIEKLGMEESLSFALADSYAKLDTSKSYLNQIDPFLNDINFYPDLINDFCVLEDAFKLACDFPFKKITMTPLVCELKKMYPTIHRHHIETILTNTFSDWIIVYNPSLKVSYPCISIIHLLRTFAKVFS